ncbi:MAG: hypothetical protein M1816_005093, partial [Peltula sp. TS41687]
QPDALQRLAETTTARMQEKFHQRNRLQELPGATQLTPWLKHTEWNTVLIQTTLTMSELARFARARQEGEDAMVAIRVRVREGWPSVAVGYVPRFTGSGLVSADIA